MHLFHVLQVVINMGGHTKRIPYSVDAAACTTMEGTMHGRAAVNVEPTE